MRMNPLLLSFVLALVCTLSHAQSCSDIGITTKEFALDSSLTQFPTWVAPISGSYTVVLARSRVGTVYRSADRGANWEVVNLGNERVRYILSSPDHKEIILVGFQNKLFISNSSVKADAWTTVEAPAFFDSSSFSFHPRHNWLIALSSNNCNAHLGSVCSDDLYLSQDGGTTWKNIRKYVWAAEWHGLPDRDNMIVVWERRAKSGNQFSQPYEADITRSDNFWSDSVVVAPDAVGFLVMDNHLFFAEFTGPTHRLVLKVSKDMGETYTTIDFPGELDEFSYRILDTSEGSTKIAVSHSEISNWAHVYGSVGADREFSLELQHVKCPKGVCDYGRVEGIEGVYMANAFRNVTGDFGWGAQTLITYDKGGKWKPLSHPSNVPGTSGRLQVQGQSDDHISYYSVPEVIGLIMTNGNVGDSVSSDIGDIGVYISRDAGWTWNFVESEPHIYEFGNRGALSIMVKNEESTDLVEYSFDEGNTWSLCHFGLPFEVNNIISDPDFGTKHFLMYGHRDNFGIFIALDFSAVHERDCHGWQTPGASSDYEYWIPHDRQGEGEDCLLGRTMKFVRRKQNATCYNPLEFSSTRAVLVRNCTCNDEDYECDYCYTRDSGDGNTCVLDTEDAACASYDPTRQPQNCKGVWYESKGYQRVPGDTCDPTGDSSLEPVEKLCSVTPPDAGGPNAGVVVLVIFVLLIVAVVGTWWLSGRNETVREWVLKVVPEKYLPEVAASTSGYAPVSLGEVLDSEDDAPEVHISDEKSSSSSS